MINHSTQTRREGYPCARVTLASGLKIARVYANFTGTVTLGLDFRRLPGPVFDSPRRMSGAHFPEQRLVIEPAGGAYHLTEKTGWGVESLMVSNLPVYRRNATSVTV